MARDQWVMLLAVVFLLTVAGVLGTALGLLLSPPRSQSTPATAPVAVVVEEPAAVTSPSPEPVRVPEPEPEPLPSADPFRTPSAAPGTSEPRISHTGTLPATPASQEVPGCASEEVRCVALTFDDGPGRHTGRLLDVLEDSGTPATFFVTGEAVSRRPALVARMVGMGMEVGNHTWDHPRMPRLGHQAQQRQVEHTDEAVVAAGAPEPVLLRPPYGEHDEHTAALGDALVLWDVDSQDWRSRDAGKVVESVMEQVRDGSIVLLHDVHPSTVDAVPELVERLTEEGYTLVTVSQVLGGAPEPGTVRQHGLR